MKTLKMGLSAALCALAGVAFGVATYDGTSAPGELRVNVDEGDSDTLDAAMVTANVTNIVKIGAGALTGVPLQSYHGDFTVDDGVFVVTRKYDLGADNCGTVYINDGASLADGCVDSSWGVRIAQGKKFVFSGNPAPGNDKFFRSVNNGTCWTMWASEMVILDDMTIDGSRQRVKWNKMIDLGGNTLTIDMKTAWSQVQMDCMVTNGGTIVVKGNDNNKIDPRSMTLQSESATFGFYPSETPCVLTLTNANLNVRYGLATHGATLNLIDAYAGTHKFGIKSRYDTFRWDGPVNALGTCAIAWNADGTNVFNIAGNISGSGTLNIGPGWLNISESPENTYTGKVTVQTGSNNKIAPEHSGVAVLDSQSRFFPDAQSITFKNGANFSLCNDYSAEIPKLLFVGNGNPVVSGGQLPIFGGRAAIAAIDKTGSGALLFETSVCVTGKTMVSEGALRLSPKVYGRAGLWEWMCPDMSKGLDGSGQSAWCAGGNDFQNGYMTTNMEDAVYSRAGAAKIFSGYASVVSNGIRRATGAIYKGYLWNRTDADVTWQLAMHMNYRGAINVNGVWSPFGGASESGTNVFTKTLHPGPNPIVIYSISASWYDRQSPSARFDGLGLSYDPNPVAGRTNVANFVKLDDGGTGRLFTIDTDDSDEALADMLPVFDDLCFAAGTAFDLNGNAFTQGNLTGFPSVENGDLTISNVWSVASAEVAVGGKMTVGGTLKFADGAKIAGTDEEALGGKTVKEYVIATADAIVGKPSVDAESASLANWRVATTATEVKLVYSEPKTVIIIR